MMSMRSTTMHNSSTGLLFFLTLTASKTEKGPATWLLKETIDVALAEVGGALEPIGAENTYREMHDPAFLQSVDEGGAIVPFKVIGKLALLVLDYVEVAALRPVIPEVHYLEGSTVVHIENRVELVRPRSWSWVCGF
uniref:Lipoxygenase domain-containing protein n=1 Tax=Fagus sylvatica TaxID=28930 RepID=A0A2N9J6Z8_FAGSY